MFSRTHAARGDETYRFSATYTLSDFPLLIGEILRRSERRLERKARARSLIHKIRAFLQFANIFLSITCLGLFSVACSTLAS
jgi:hypothetical protein